MIRMLQLHTPQNANNEFLHVCMQHNRKQNMCNKQPNMFTLENSIIAKSIYQHYSDAILSVMVSQITGIPIAYPKRKHQSSTSLVFVKGIHRSPVNSPHKGPVTWKLFPFVDIIMKLNSLTVFGTMDITWWKQQQLSPCICDNLCWEMVDGTCEQTCSKNLCDASNYLGFAYLDLALTSLYTWANVRLSYDC